MRQVTKYKANDGSEFTDAAECIKHERNCADADEIMSKLPTKPNTCDFSNGGGYLQHDKDTFLVVRNKFCEFAKRYTDHKWIQDTIDNGMDAHPSWVGRMIDECAPRSISKLWYRFMCVDSEFREWGQPYYADNPDKADQTCLNT